MKRRLFIILPVIIVLLAALCVGVVFAASQISGPITDEEVEFVPAQGLTFKTPLSGETVTATLESTKESNGGIRADYRTSNHDLYSFINGELNSAIIHSVENDTTGNEKIITSEEARTIAVKFFSDREDFHKYTCVDEAILYDGSYSLSFNIPAGEFAINDGYSITILPNGKISFWRYARGSAENFDTTLVNGITKEMIEDYCEAQVGGPVEIEKQLIYIVDGEYVLGTSLTFNGQRDFQVVDYPLG